MSANLNISLPDELHSFVTNRANGTDIYADPADYVRDLIRRDMQLAQEKRAAYHALLLGAEQANCREIVPESVLDILNED